MNRYIYHYWAERQVSHGFENVDGIVLMNCKIVNVDDYRDLKKLIVEDIYDMPDKSLDRWVIKSLSFLGME